MPESAVEFWCRSPLQLDEVFARFKQAFGVDDFIHDAENVWEWFSGQAQDPPLAFNITRQWSEDGVSDEPVRMSLVFRDASTPIEEIGHRLAKALDADVHTGTIRHIKGDEFAFEVQRTFSRSQ